MFNLTRFFICIQITNIETLLDYLWQPTSPEPGNLEKNEVIRDLHNALSRYIQYYLWQIQVIITKNPGPGSLKLRSNQPTGFERLQPRGLERYKPLQPPHSAAVKVFFSREFSVTNLSNIKICLCTFILPQEMGILVFTRPL